MSAKIALAVRACLAECEPVRSPLVHLHLFIERLREQPGWTWKEVREVERRVARVLKTLMDNKYWAVTWSDSDRQDRSQTTQQRANRFSQRPRPSRN
jgi:hypothetical protein